METNCIGNDGIIIFYLSIDIYLSIWIYKPIYIIQICGTSVRRAAAKRGGLWRVLLKKGIHTHYLSFSLYMYKYRYRYIQICERNKWETRRNNEFWGVTGAAWVNTITLLSCIHLYPSIYIYLSIQTDRYRNLSRHTYRNANGIASFGS